jgi:hypothetical protein
MPHHNMTENLKPSTSLVFTADALDMSIADVIPAMPPPAKWPAFNAIRHLNRAWKLVGTDDEMATLRAITAEEEAATALFLSLKRHGYDGANLLKPRDHVHKNAVFPFLVAMGRAMERFADQFPQSQFYLDTSEDPPRLLFRFHHEDPRTEEAFWAYPQPPLNFSVASGKVNEEPRPEDFASGITELLADVSAKSILEYLRKRANDRNLILYAASAGYYAIQGSIEEGLKYYQRNVFVILRAYLMVDPYNRKQLFVQQALTAFLRTLKALPSQEELSAG